MTAADAERVVGLSDALVVAERSLPDPATPDAEPLTLAEAAELTARIGQALEHAEMLIARAYLGRVWEALNLPSWNAWVDRHFGDRPILMVPRQERPDVVHDLRNAGLSGRAIARAIGVSEGTVRNDLGAQNCAPSDLVECPTCGESHPPDVGTCPYLENAFGHITAHGDGIDDRHAYGPGAQHGNIAAGDASDELPDEAAACEDDESDTEDEPLPTNDDAFQRPEAEATRRLGRLGDAIERVAVLRDDLDELPALVDTILRDCRDWPPAAAPGGDLAARLRAQLTGLRRAAGELPRWLVSANEAANALEACS